MANEKEHRRNEHIDASQVRVIDPDGEQVGIRPISEALGLARDHGLDLVEIVPSAKPPVCRIMDYGKFRFEQSKKAQAARKKQKQIQVKEVKFRPATEEADFQVKMRNIRRFLEEGDKVKISLRFRGREMAHQEIGREQLERVEEELGDLITVEQRPQMDGRQMVMMLSPKKR